MKLETWAFFIIGLPGENVFTIKQTIDFSRELKTNFSQFYIFAPGNGSPIYKMMRKKGIIKPFEWLQYKEMIKKTTECLGENIGMSELIGFQKEAIEFKR